MYIIESARLAKIGVGVTPYGVFWASPWPKPRSWPLRLASCRVSPGPTGS